MTITVTDKEVVKTIKSLVQSGENSISKILAHHLLTLAGRFFRISSSFASNSEASELLENHEVMFPLY